MIFNLIWLTVLSHIFRDRVLFNWVQSFRTVTSYTDSAVNQSKLKAAEAKRGKTCASGTELFLILLLIGWQSGALVIQRNMRITFHSKVNWTSLRGNCSRCQWLIIRRQLWRQSDWKLATKTLSSNSFVGNIFSYHRNNVGDASI